MFEFDQKTFFMEFLLFASVLFVIAGLVGPQSSRTFFRRMCRWFYVDSSLIPDISVQCVRYRTLRIYKKNKINKRSYTLSTI